MKNEKSLSGMMVKFVIGLILLTISWNYLQKHPAEKEAIGSGFVIMYEKVQLRWYEVIGKGETSVVRYKQQLEDSYDDMLLAASYIPECEGTTEIQDMNNMKDDLHNQHLEEFEKALTAHYAKYLSFQQFINSGCVIE